MDGGSVLELDGNDLQSDLLSGAEVRVGSAENFQWSPTLSEQILSLRILIY